MDAAWQAVGCDQCAQTGYQGRLLLAELLLLTESLRQAILARSDTTALEAAAGIGGGPTIWSAGRKAAQEGLTTLQELERVLGPVAGA